MRKNIKVSVVVAVYNVAPYLRQCLDSLCGQTLKEIEILCVDDGSTDGSLEILKEYEEKDSRVTVISKKNQGAGVARNKGIDLASGEYLSFLDADDYFAPTMLQELYEEGVEKDAELVICQSRRYDEGKHIMTMEPRTYHQQLPQEKTLFTWKDLPQVPTFLFGNEAWNKFVKRQFILEHNLRFQEVFRNNDLYFTFFLFIYAKRISFLRRVLHTYRVGMSTNSQATLERYPFAYLAVFEAIDSRLKQCGCGEKEEQYFRLVIGSVVLYMLRQAKNGQEYRGIYENIKNVVIPKYQLLDPCYAVDMPPLLTTIGTESFEDFCFHTSKKEQDKREFQQKEALKAVGKNFCFFGAGAEGVGALYFLQNHQLPLPLFFCDNGREKQGTFLEGIPVISWEQALEQYEQFHVVITNQRYYEEIRKQVQEKISGDKITRFLLFLE